MKITYESHGKTTTIEDTDDIDIFDLREILYNLCLSQSWDKKLLKRIFKKNG